ncbi:hypothetical protein BGZ99_004733 [Dissophora globulifera]|uniref:BTB domain-containing protein n=1 Tax=Dissophora globulifera TaxID=979702 RepID=A0A9P6UZV9_9FUNG|nr:hypothetical protein BGZ99_004733 [Dissophora globulifera]
MPPSIVRTDDITLRIIHPELNYFDKITLQDDSRPGLNVCWWVKIIRRIDKLSIQVHWSWYSLSCQNCKTENHDNASLFHGSAYTEMRLLSHTKRSAIDTVHPMNDMLSANTFFYFDVEIDKVLLDGQYCFDIVISSSRERAQNLIKLQQPEAVLKVNSSPLSKTEREISIKRLEIMNVLLRDLDSVNFCFVFSSNTTTPMMALYAHGSILSRYKTMEQMFLQADELPGRYIRTSEWMSTQEQSQDTSSSFSFTSSATTVRPDEEEESHNSENDDIAGICPLAIIVDQFSLATLCVMLRFIYTGKIDLIADTRLHAITSGVLKSTKVLPRTLGLPYIPSLHLWTSKEVTWEELLLAADFFGILDLRPHCLQAVIDTIDKMNAIEILFRLGGQFDDIKEATIDYIVKNMASIFSQHDGKPFAPFKSHPQCCDFMSEVMQRKATATA